MSWNDWRVNYYNMNYNDQKRFYSEIEEIYPDQTRFNFQKTISFFAMIGEYVDVFEFGGGKGKLADRALRMFDMIKSWDNYEIFPAAKTKSVCKDKRYKCIILDNFVWNVNISKKYNVFYASHSTEHIKFNEFKTLIESINAKYVYIDMPIDDDVLDKNWFGYGGSHILEVGWKQINEFMSSCYYEVNRNGFYIKVDDII